MFLSISIQKHFPIVPGSDLNTDPTSMHERLGNKAFLGLGGEENCVPIFSNFQNDCKFGSHTLSHSSVSHIQAPLLRCAHRKWRSGCSLQANSLYFLASELMPSTIHSFICVFSKYLLHLVNNSTLPERMVITKT